MRCMPYCGLTGAQVRGGCGTGIIVDGRVSSVQVECQRPARQEEECRGLSDLDEDAIYASDDSDCSIHAMVPLDIMIRLEWLIENASGPQRRRSLRVVRMNGAVEVRDHSSFPGHGSGTVHHLKEHVGPKTMFIHMEDCEAVIVPGDLDTKDCFHRWMCQRVGGEQNCIITLLLLSSVEQQIAPRNRARLELGSSIPCSGAQKR